VSDRIFVTVDGREELAEIDPSFDQVAARYPLTGCKGSHGLLIDSENGLAFAACEENSKLVVFDLQSKKATATLTVGADPDVLAFDTSLHRSYRQVADDEPLFPDPTQMPRCLRWCSRFGTWA
jgi:DNA-binding beta-propeller fold protein YncE